MGEFKLVRTASDRGARAGVVANDVVYDAADELGRDAFTSVKAILAAGDEVQHALARIAERPSTKGQKLAGAKLLEPVDEPSGIFCIGANFRDHSASWAKAYNMTPEPDSRELGVTPWFFVKTAHALVGPDAKVELRAERLDWEAELAVIIGKSGRDVPAARALDLVGYYTIANDLSARDRSARPKIRDGSPFKFDWTAHKNFDGACPLGPALIPARAISDPQNLAIKLSVNGEMRQDSSTNQMIYPVAEQVAFLSTLVTLRPGDVILTGTPAGTGVESKTYLKRGDKMTAEIEGLGQLTTYIV